MSLDAFVKFEELAKAFEAGVPNGAPGALVNGAAVSVIDQSTAMKNVCWTDKQIVLQKVLTNDPCKSTLATFERQISYGSFKGKAVFEGHAGQEDDLAIVTAVVPMAYYAEIRKASLQSDIIKTKDGISGTDRQANAATKTIAGRIERDCFLGFSNFSNGGLFDGHPGAIPKMPGMHGLELQIRQSDGDRKSHDQMFEAYGGGDTVVIPVGATLSQAKIEDGWVRSNMNHGEAERLILDPIGLSNYNKLGIAKERIVLANSPQELQGTSLRKQATSGGMVSLEPSRFLSGQTSSTSPTAKSPLPPTTVVTASVTDANAPTTFVAAQVYQYYVATENEAGESSRTANSAPATIAVTADTVTVTITHPTGTNRFYNVYRSAAGGTLASAKFIGSVVQRRGQATTIFTDLNAKLPAFTTAFLIQEGSDVMEMKEMSPFSTKKLAESELFSVTAFFSFRSVALYLPRQLVLFDNVI